MNRIGVSIIGSSAKRGLVGLVIAVMILAGVASFQKARAGHPPATIGAKPNIVVILLDDVGFGALSPFGGPIRTPNMDKLASRGLRYTSFHTTALCSPTRAALLSGRNHHSMGTGVVTELESEYPGYTGILPKDKALLPRVLKDRGYATFALGKWHNTPIYEVSPSGPFDRWPTGVGFERFYGFQGGDTSQWQPTLWENTTPREYPKAAGYHFTVDMTDHAIQWLTEAHSQRPDQPFFLYFAPGAAHAPHHAPAEYSARYRGRFDEGWDKVREETLVRQKQLGIVPEDTELPSRADGIQAWASLSKDEKRLYARMMEIYAGFVEHTDEQIGRLMETIDRLGESENTIVILTSDNGASGEGGPLGSYNEHRLFNGLGESLKDNLRDIDKLGGPATYNHYPAGWAQAMNTPVRYWKQITHEGGVRDPFIISWPGHLNDQGGFRNQFVHVNDVVPTLLELTAIQAPSVVDGIRQKPMEGISFATSLFDGSAPAAKKVQYFEMFGNRGVWKDGWKAVTFHGRLPWDMHRGAATTSFESDKWELFDTTQDFNEVHDLAAKYPEKVQALKKTFDEEAKKYDVYPLQDDPLGRAAAASERRMAGKTEFEYPGDTLRIPESLSPPVKNRSFTITASLTVPSSGCEGAIVHMGGRFGGYALYCKAGHLYYAHNFVAETIYTVASEEVVPAGREVIRFEFQKTGVVSGITKGIARLFVGDRKVGEGEISRTVPVLYGLGETFDIGRASGTTVTGEFETPFAFTGTIEKVVFHLEKDQGPTPAPVLDD